MERWPLGRGMDRFCWKERPTPGEAFLVLLPTGEQVGMCDADERSAPRVWDSYDLLAGAHVGFGPTSERDWAMSRPITHIASGEVSPSGTARQSASASARA